MKNIISIVITIRAHPCQSSIPVTSVEGFLAIHEDTMTSNANTRNLDHFGYLPMEGGARAAVPGPATPLYVSGTPTRL